ncbi:MAG: methanogenesis marker 17 protein [Methanomassiliicoccus sp.]|nr:methanogenesis marker 17 protein [Methanomassiliicoccus sp.]
MTLTDESFAYDNFESIFRQILQDLGITRSVLAFRIVADPQAPYFLISVRLGRARSAIKVADMSQLNTHTGGTAITITDEAWAPALLNKLWQKYGRDRVEQLTRFEILVRGAELEEVSAMELDPGEELKAKVLDAVWRLFPEGFTVRYNIVDDRAMTIIGTEHDMSPQWVNVAQMVHKEMQVKEAD